MVKIQTWRDEISSPKGAVGTLSSLLGTFLFLNANHLLTYHIINTFAMSVCVYVYMCVFTVSLLEFKLHKGSLFSSLLDPQDLEQYPVHWRCSLNIC